LSKIDATTKINAGFLAIVLIVGTFAAITPSFIIGVNAQTEPYGMDQQKYNSPEPDYGMDSYKKPKIFQANKVSELGDRWWQWISGLDSTVIDPFTDIGQAGCDVGLQDNGKLLFLVGSNRDEKTGDFPVHKCDVKKGTSILFPIVNVVCDTLEINTPFFGAKEQDQRTCANDLLDKAPIAELHVTIDGFEVKNPEQYRIDSPAGGFNINAVENNPVGIPAGSGSGVSDGFWILLKKLQPGEHIISFSGVLDFTEVPDLEDVLEYGATYILDVQPPEIPYYPEDYQQNYQKY
jgi:hypothetical protein